MAASISVGVLFAMSALSALHAAPDWGGLGAVRPLPNPTPFAEGGELRLREEMRGRRIGRGRRAAGRIGRTRGIWT